MELRQLEYFIEICKTRNFTKAAENLCVAQSSVTKAIQNLEYELGVTLFDRSQKPVNLTEEGACFYPQVQSSLAALNAATEEIRNMSIAKEETIHFGVPSYVGYKLKELITSPQFLKKQRFRFNIVERSNPEIEKRLLDGSLNIGWFINGDKTSYLSFLPVERQEVYCIMNNHSDLSKKEKLTFKELAEERFLMSEMSETQNAATLVNIVYEQCHKAGFSPISELNTSEYLPNLDLCLQYIQMGMGISFMPQYVAWDLLGVSIRPMDPPLTLDIGIAWNKRHKLSVYEKEFIQYIQTAYLDFIKGK